jgi:hypothetical protein
MFKQVLYPEVKGRKLPSKHVNINPTRRVDTQKRNTKESYIINIADHQTAKVNRRKEIIFKPTKTKSANDRNKSLPISTNNFCVQRLNNETY